MLKTICLLSFAAFLGGAALIGCNGGDGDTVDKPLMDPKDVPPIPKKPDKPLLHPSGGGGGPAPSGPKAGGPSTGGPGAGGPKAGGPKAGGPSMGGPATGGPKTGGPSAGGPAAGGAPTPGPKGG